MKSAYIHIPFCARKCLYCDFNSFEDKQNLIEYYIDALIKEIKRYDIKELETIYIGGGTPSFIEAKHISRILSILPLKNASEITIEVNPGTVDYNKLIEYKNAGINRISIGLQTTNNEILKEIGRIHTLEEFENAYNLVREVGFENVNVDLMFGLPDQDLDIFKESIEYLIKLNPEHISSYSLILHEKIFSNLPNDEEEREMYHYLVKRLKEAGYKHYEISNFSKKGFESKHNMAYWKQKEYYGFGAGASSYLDGKRCTNILNLNEYIEKIKSGKEVSIVEEEESLDSKINEYMMLGLRLIDGINIKEVNEKFGIDVLERYKESLSKLINLGLIELQHSDRDFGAKGYIVLTAKGLDLANVVWEEFV